MNKKKKLEENYNEGEKYNYFYLVINLRGHCC